MRNSLARLDGVTRLYGFQPALRAVDLDLASGEFLAVVGPNGAGKTTLLRLLAGLTRPTRGRLELSVSRARIGYLSHQSLLYDELTGFENLLFWARLYGVERPEEHCRRLLEGVRMSRSADRPVKSCSEGMRQRLSVARALVHEPALLLLDEPYSGLDRQGGLLLSELLESVHRRGRTVVLVTHNLAEGIRLADRVVLLDRGALVLDRDAGDLDAVAFERLYLESVGRREEEL